MNKDLFCIIVVFDWDFNFFLSLFNGISTFAGYLMPKLFS